MGDREGCEGIKACLMYQRTALADLQTLRAQDLLSLSGLRLSASDTTAVAGAGTSGCFITPVLFCPPARAGSGGS